MATAPSWSCTATATSITARVTDKGEYSYFSWGLRTSDGTIISSATAYSTATSKTYSGLSPNTTYRVYMSWSHSTTGEGNYDYEYVTTLKARPSNWSWSSTVQKGKAVPTTKVGNNAYEAAYLTASEWNDFWDRIVEFLEYTGHTISGSATRVESGDPMLLSQANDYRTAIELMNPPVALPAELTAGSRITAAFINGLAASLNSIS